MNNDVKQQLLSQVGSQLQTTFFMFDNSILNPETVPIEEFERMVETDETVAVGIQFIISSVLMKLGEYQHENEKITDFVNQNFEEMQGNLHTACEDILSAIWNGYSGTEIVWKASGSNIVLNRLATYHPKTIYINVDRQTGEYQGFKQWRWFAGSPIDIPVEKSILYSHNARFGNHYGKSILKPARKNWLLKDPILKMWARALDRFGTPLMTILTPDELIDDPDNPGNQINQMEWAKRQLDNLQSRTGIVLRSSASNEGETKVEAVTNGGSGIGESFEKAIQYLNKMILRSMLVPSLVFDEGGRSGSYALGQSHFGIFNLGVTNIYNGLTEALLEQLVRRLVDINFGPQNDYGSFIENEIESEDIRILFEGFVQLTNSGYMDPQVQEDFDAVRLKMGLPQRKVVTKDEQMVQAKENAYARYTSGDIGDPFTQENDAGSNGNGENNTQTD